MVRLGDGSDSLKICQMSSVQNCRHPKFVDVNHVAFSCASDPPSALPSADVAHGHYEAVVVTANENNVVVVFIR